MTTQSQSTISGKKGLINNGKGYKPDHSHDETDYHQHKNGRGHQEHGNGYGKGHHKPREEDNGGDCGNGGGGNNCNYSLTICLTNKIEDEDGADNTNASGTFNGTSYTDHDDSILNNALKFNLPFQYNGPNPLTYTISPTVTVNGHTFSIINNNNGTFSLNTSEFQYLNNGQAVVLNINISATDGTLTASGLTKVTIVGTSDNHAPCVQNVCYTDDEDGLNTINPNDTEINARLVFSMHGTDSDGDTLTYQIKTGTFSNNGQTYTVATTSTAGTYTVTNNGQTFTIKDLGNGKFEYLTSEFQYLNNGETRTLVFQYCATDGHGGTSNTAKAVVTIVGTSDNHAPVANWVHYADDEDGDNTFNPNDTEVPNRLVFDFPATDEDGDVLTIHLVTGTYTHGGNTYILTETSTPGTYTISLGYAAWETYTVKDLGNGQFEYLTSEFQFLNNGEERFLPLQYYVTDSHGASSLVNWAKTTIYGREDTILVACEQQFVDDEDAVDATGATSGAYTDLDDGETGTLVFKIDNVNYNGSGTLTYTVPTSVTVDGHTYSITNLGNGRFGLDQSQFQFLGTGERVEFTLNYSVTDGTLTSNSTAKVVVIGLNDCPIVWEVCKQDDEDADPNVAPNDSTGFGWEGWGYIGFNFEGSDPEGDALTYTIQTGTFTTNDGNSFTVTYAGDIAGKPWYTVKDLATNEVFYVGNNQDGTLRVHNFPLQYLDDGEFREFAFRFTATDPDGCQSGAGTYKIKIWGTNDNAIPCDFVREDDEDGDETYAPNDTQVADQLVFDMLGLDREGDPIVAYQIVTGTYATNNGETYTIAETSANHYTITTQDGRTYSFEYLTATKQLQFDKSQFQYLNLGDIEELQLKFKARDDHHANFSDDIATGTIRIYGTDEPNECPVVWDICKQDDEDGNPNIAPNDGIGSADGAWIKFNFEGSDPDGDPLTYSVKTGTFTTNEGVSYTVGDWTTVNGLNYYYITNNTSGGTVYIRNLGDGNYEVATWQFRGLDDGEFRDFAFRFTATDTHGCESNTGTYKVRIWGVNDNAIACDFIREDDEDGDTTVAPNDSVIANQLVFDMLGVDYEGDPIVAYQIVTGSYTTHNGETYTIANVSGNNYTITTQDGHTYSFSYLPGTLQIQFNTSEFQYLNLGQMEELQFKFRARDDHHADFDAFQATATIRIHGTDEGLTANNVTYIDDEDAIDGTGASAIVNGVNTVDADDGIPSTLQFNIGNVNYTGSGTLTYTIPTSVTVNGITYAITNLGNGKFELDKAQFQHLSVGEAVVLTFNYTVTDGTISSTAETKVTIIGTNDGIDAVDDNAGTINDGDSVTVPVLGNDTDTDGDDLDVSSINSLVINGVTIPQAQWAQYFTVDNETGQLVFNSANMNVPAGTTQSVVINYTATDPYGATDSANVFVNVRGPQVTLDATDQQFVDDEDAIDGTGATSGAFTDQDNGIPGTLQFQINAPQYNGSGALTYSGIPTSVTVNGITYAITNLGNGAFTLDKSQFQHLAVGERVEFTFNYTVTDGTLTDTAQTKVVIIGTNDGPDAVNDIVGTINEGATVTVNVLGNDSDPDGDPINVTKIWSITIDGVLITDPAQVAQYVTILPNGQLFINTSSIPDKDHNYGIVVNYEISDPYGLKDRADVFLNVNNVTKVIYYGDNENGNCTLVTNPALAVDSTVITSASVANQVKNYANNTVVLDNADAYGDFGNFDVRVTAGNATAFASPLLEGGTEYALANTDAAIRNNTFNFGDDNVTVNRGLIVGDVDNLTLFGHQGNAAANYDPNCFSPFAKATANVAISGNTFNFGDDTLKIGSGDIIGDVQKLTFTYENGTATGNGTLNDNDNWNFGNTFNFGNDNISAREGTLTGDLAKVVVNGVTYDLSVASQLAAFQATSAYTNNTFHFGSDTFSFNANEPLNVKITDFGIGGVHDTLKITGLSDVNGGGIDLSDLIARSAVVNDGTGHIKLALDLNNDGIVDGTISFTNILFDATKLEITDYLTAGDIIASA